MNKGFEYIEDAEYEDLKTAAKQKLEYLLSKYVSFQAWDEGFIVEVDIDLLAEAENLHLSTDPLEQALGDFLIVFLESEFFEASELVREGDLEFEKNNIIRAIISAYQDILFKSGRGRVYSEGSVNTIKIPNFKQNKFYE